MAKFKVADNVKIVTLDRVDPIFEYTLSIGCTGVITRALTLYGTNDVIYTVELDNPIIGTNKIIKSLDFGENELEHIGVPKFEIEDKVVANLVHDGILGTVKGIQRQGEIFMYIIEDSYDSTRFECRESCLALKNEE